MLTILSRHMRNHSRAPIHQVHGTLLKFQLRIFSRNLDLETSPLKTELIFEIISKYGINEEFGIGVIFILADRFANPPVKGVL